MPWCERMPQNGRNSERAVIRANSGANLYSRAHSYPPRWNGAPSQEERAASEKKQEKNRAAPQKARHISGNFAKPPELKRSLAMFARSPSNRRMSQAFFIAWDRAGDVDQFLDLLGNPAAALEASSDNDCDRRAHFAMKLFDAADD